MPGNLNRRVAKLEEKTGGHGRMMHVIDLSDLPRDYDVDRALDELGIERGQGNLVVTLLDPTGREPPPDGKPILISSKAM